MKKYYVTALVLSLMTAFSAQAARPKSQVMTVKRSSIINGSSEHMRINKDYMLTAQPYGYSVAPVQSAGINGGLYLDSNSLLQFELSKGVTTLTVSTDSNTTTASADLESFMAGVNYKRFFGNSFYLKAGADYRRIGFSNLIHSSSFNNIHGEIVNNDTLVGNIAIGNQWQWETFTMGCDWIGVNPPLINLKTEANTANLTAYQKQDIEDIWKDLGKTTSYQFMRVYLGASF